MATSTWWPASARLAIALARNGCLVFAICPRGHPLQYVGAVKRVYELHGLRSRAALLAAIRDAKPDFLIPCDDRIVSQLHELFGLHAELRPLIEDSLGDAGGFPITDSRRSLLKVAADLGIQVPRWASVGSAGIARETFGRFGPIAVMKMDGTHGGEGVRMVRSADEAAAAFRSLRLSAGLLTAVQRLLVYGDPLAIWSWARRARLEITIQEYIPGTPANNMVACWRGDILNDVAVEAISCEGATGSANVVRRFESPQLTRAATLLARHLRISGFFGLDFILEQSSGKPFLIELNPRCTQLGHLQFADRGDLASALCARLTGRPRLPLDAPITGNMVAFFPQAWKSSSPGDDWYSAFQDVPWAEKSLVEYLMHEPWPDRRWQAHAYRMIRGPKRKNRDSSLTCQDSSHP